MRFNDILQNIDSASALERIRSAADSASLASSDSVLPVNFPKESPESLPDSLNLPVPLFVDGMKLGAAAIRGINAVTRATGKLNLNI